ncbi:MAG: ABC transporter substrate-binding protein [Candidatus Natronoplasma sp.]
MKGKIAILFTGLLLLSILSSGCVDQDIDGGSATITDMAGREVEVPKDVENIVGVGSGCMRLLCYMNATEYLAGVEEYEKEDPMGRPYRLANPDLAEKDSIGPIHGGDMELIAAQEPDVIFRASSADPAEDYEEKTGIPTVDLAIGDLTENRESFYGSLRLIGEILQKEERAEEIIDHIDSTIQDLDDRTKDIPSEEKPEVYVGGVLYRGSHPLTSTYGEYDPFYFVNADNAAGELGTEHAMVDEEQILEWDPEVIFVDMGSYVRGETILDNSTYGNVTAFQNEYLYGILPYNWHHINYGTVLSDSYYIGKVLYPEVFDDVNPEEKADEIYEELVGEPVYDEMEEDLEGFAQLEPSE